jgi:hypothetical protein
MFLTWTISCLFFCVALAGCSTSKKSPADFCTVKVGPRGILSLDVGECSTCEVDPNDEKMKAIHNVNSRKNDDVSGTVGLKGIWKF